MSACHAALLAAARIALPYLTENLNGVLETSCLLDFDHNPIRSTMGDGARVHVAQVEADIAQLTAAIDAAAALERLQFVDAIGGGA